MFGSAWTMGAPGLHRPLEKLLGTWRGVFPAATLEAVRARMAAPGAQYAGSNGHHPAQAAGPIPMTLDPRLAGAGQGAYPQPPPQQQQPYGAYDYGAAPPAYGAYPPQQPMPAYGAPPAFDLGGYPVAAAAPPSYQQQQQPLAQPALQQQGPPAAAAPLPDLLSSLLTSGLLTAPGGPPAAAAPPAARPLKRGRGGPAAAVGFPASVEFSADRIKVLEASELGATTIFLSIKICAAPPGICVYGRRSPHHSRPGGGVGAAQRCAAAWPAQQQPQRSAHGRVAASNTGGLQCRRCAAAGPAMQPRLRLGRLRDPPKPHPPGCCCFIFSSIHLASALCALLQNSAPPAPLFPSSLLQEGNPAAVRRLLTATETTKKNFLDRKFLRRQKHSTGLRLSRMWYVDLDTWLASTTGTGHAAAAAAAGSCAAPVAQRGGAAAAAAPAEAHGVPADDEQTHCALSGERFEQYWDEAHQEWRYRNARRLGGAEAAAHGLADGALVLVGALGAPRAAAEAPPEGGAAAAGEVKAEGGVKEEAAAVKEEEVKAEAEAEAEEGPAAKRVKVEPT
jgi:hypothetical protein